MDQPMDKLVPSKEAKIISPNAWPQSVTWPPVLPPRQDLNRYPETGLPPAKRDSA